MMRMIAVLGLGLMVFVGGCGPSEPKTYPVSGTVTWNGEPLPDGDIVFIDEAQEHLQDHGKIKNGKYEGRVKAGKKKVQILATKESGKFDPAMGAVPRIQYIPLRYNGETTLKTEIKTEGENTFSFPLKE